MRRFSRQAGILLLQKGESRKGKTGKKVCKKAQKVGVLAKTHHRCTHREACLGRRVPPSSPLPTKTVRVGEENACPTTQPHSRRGEERGVFVVCELRKGGEEKERNDHFQERK